MTKQHTLTLPEMAKLYSLTKKYIHLDSFDLVKMLYKSDIEKFNQVFVLVFGKKCETQEELVARIILRSGIDNCGLYQFDLTVRGKNA